jgi:hypothetical protein
MKIKIELLSNSNRTQHNIVFTSDKPMSDEDLCEVLVKWVAGLYDGGKDEKVSQEQGRTDQT